MGQDSMNILIFGDTGMVAQSVLRECLLAGDVERVQTVGRTPVGQASLKLRNRGSRRPVQLRRERV